MIATPQLGHAPAEATDYRIEVAHHLGKSETRIGGHEFVFVTVPDAAVQFARQKIAEGAVKMGVDFVGMMDDDMKGGPLDIWERLLAHNVDIVAALAFTRMPPHYPVCFAVRGGEGNIERRTFYNEPIKNYPKNKLFECDAVGFGAVLIRTKVIESLEKDGKAFEFTTAAGEDIQFCHRARMHGFRVFMDTSVKLLHFGPPRWIGEEDYEKSNPKVAELRESAGEWTKEKRDEGLGQ